MGFIRKEDIKGYCFRSDFVCLDCATDKELSELMEEQILTESNMSEEDYYFCDRCAKTLWKKL